jgi:hypothetical protein
MELAIQPEKGQNWQGVERRSVEAIVRALNVADVRYLVAGGLAVVAHGYVRFTADVDLILDLEDKNVRRGLDALKALGYRPRAPVPIDQFADSSIRQNWIREKGMTVFSLNSPDHAATEVDIFAQEPLDFARAYGAASRMEIAPGLSATFVSLDDLIMLKRVAARPEDLTDITRLIEINKQT